MQLNNYKADSTEIEYTGWPQKASYKLLFIGLSLPNNDQFLIFLPARRPTFCGKCVIIP